MRKVILLILCETGLVAAAVTAYSVTEITPAWVWPIAAVFCFATATALYFPEMRRLVETRHNKNTGIGDTVQSKTVPPQEQRPIPKRVGDSPPFTTNMPPTPALQQAGIQLRDRRPYTLRTVDEILREFEGRTTMQAERIVQQYLDKWMIVDNIIDDIVEADTLILVYVGGRSWGRILMMFEKSRWQGQLEVLTTGDRIKGKGRISEIEIHRLTLTDCELNVISRQ